MIIDKNGFAEQEHACESWCAAEHNGRRCAEIQDQHRALKAAANLCVLDDGTLLRGGRDIFTAAKLLLELFERRYMPWIHK